MSYQANICCDKCGKTEKLEQSEDNFIIWNVEFRLPDNWDTFDGKDLCSDCYKKLQDLLEVK